MPAIITQIRIKVLDALFRFSKLENIRSHWIYSSTLNNQSVVIDLGANLGEFSRLLKEKIDGQFYLVEPNLTLLESINIPGVKKFNYAISKNNEVVKFYLSKNHEASSLIEGFESRWETSSIVEVEGVNWTMLLQKLGIAKNTIIDVLKVDIEGSELDLIESLSADELMSIKQITIEFHDWINPQLQERTIAAIEILNSNGFTGYTNSPNHEWPTEILFIRNSDLALSFFEKISLAVADKLSFLKYRSIINS